MPEQYQPPKVLVDNEYTELPKDGVYDMAEQKIIRQTRALGGRAIPRISEWGPDHHRDENRNRPEPDAPEGLTYSA